jgi:type VI secretion system protein ImpA
MAEIDLAALISPISEGEPCGPDLDLAGDADYMNFVAKTESLIPSSFFSGPEGQPFDRSSIDFAAELAAMKPLLADTRDIRLLVLLAKLLILNRDLAGFETAVRAIQELLNQYWDTVHPRGDDGVFNARAAAIETLDDLPPVIFPLQYTPLVRHPRLGAISYRHYMIASGEVQAREGEETPDLTAIENALMEVELAELVAALGSIDSMRTALADIRSVCVDRAGIEQAPSLERLPGLVDKIRTLLNGFVVKRDPSAALAGGAGEGAEAGAAVPEVTGEVRSLADAAAALAAIADYFVRKEPSNPALLLVRQAEQLMGKSFVEVMQILVPTHVEQAAIYIGKEQTLQLPIGRLSELVSSSGESPAANGDDSELPPRHLEANTRADAIRLLDQIGIFYRAAEPSSPLPYLTDRARDLANRDFLSLLKHVLPALHSSD